MIKSNASSPQSSSVIRNLLTALVVIILTVVGEYYFRHYVMYWMPTFGNLRVNDMVALFLVYLLLLGGVGLATKTNWRQELAGVRRAIPENAQSWNFAMWFALLSACLFILPIVDKLLWSRFHLPFWISPYRNPSVWLRRLALPLKVVSMLLVNGVFIPFAEEYLWRGNVQARLLRVLPAPVAIGLTAALFSLKHVVVDASWGRFLTLTAFGIICGVLARRKSWRDSATMHMFINILSTIVFLIQGMP